MGYGMFAFTALGDSYFAHGALAGLYAAIAAGVVCVGLGDRTTTVYAPRVTTTFLLGALLYDLVHSDAEVLRGGNVHLIVLAFFSIIFLGWKLELYIRKVPGSRYKAARIQGVHNKSR